MLPTKEQEKDRRARGKNPSSTLPTLPAVGNLSLSAPAKNQQGTNPLSLPDKEEAMEEEALEEGRNGVQ